uniref:hypothetical protein n=1 Tax=Methylibium sp. TaxID=2067992 RepID=UPI00286D5C3F
VTRIYGDHEHGDTHPLRHAAAFAIIDRDAYIPNFFGFPFNGESVAFRTPVVELTKLIDKDNTILDPDDPVQWSDVCANFDILLVLLERPPSGPAPGCVEPLVVGKGFTVYRIVREPR